MIINKSSNQKNGASELMRVGLIRWLNSIHTSHSLSRICVNCSEQIIRYLV